MKEVATVYRTEDLSIFKTLQGNRAVKERRKQKLIESIDKHGYITNPIIVNERYEVIEGQARLSACKELNSPIDFIIVPNIGINECQILNMYGETWKVRDFIECYATRGNENYRRIQKLGDMVFGIRTYMFANGIYGGTSTSENIIKEGRAISSETTFENAKKALEYLKTLKPFTDKVDGRRTDLESAVISISSAMDEISKIYNRNLQGHKRLYLREDFDRFRH